MTKHPKVLIEGHCDELGTTEYNIALGDRRAVAIKQYYVWLGMPEKNIRILSYGNERPSCTKDLTDACRSRNRRGITQITTDNVVLRSDSAEGFSDVFEVPAP